MAQSLMISECKKKRRLGLKVQRRATLKSDGRNYSNLKHQQRNLPAVVDFKMVLCFMCVFLQS